MATVRELAASMTKGKMTHCLDDYYKIPPDWSKCFQFASSAGKSGFFRFGREAICFGKCQTGEVSKAPNGELYDATNDARLIGSNVHLPFDPDELINNLHRERYEQDLRPLWERTIGRKLPHKVYYSIRSSLPFSLRRSLQRAYFSGWQKMSFPAWPVDFTADILHEELLKLAMKVRGVQKLPFIWFWPDGAPSCFIMTHDVEDSPGRDLTRQLMDLDESYGIRASFQVVPEERYEVTADYIAGIRSRGFELNVHDLNHDGHLYREKDEFLRRAKRINEHVRRFKSKGFRAGSMHRNVDWYDVFEFSYDMSVPNVAHLEPKRGGCCTVMPFFIGSVLELPLTTTQDYSLFHILNDYSIDLWKRQLDLIRGKNGLISFITHADYLMGPHERKVYETLLHYLNELIASSKIWAALPGEVDHWWRARHEMRLVSYGSSWKIEGPESERARLAYAMLDHDCLRYELQ